MHLSDLFIELLTFVTETLAKLDVVQPPYQQMREKVVSLIEPRYSGDFTAEEVTAARFAVCGWTDEQIAKSKWEHKDLWLKEPLQRIYFNTSDAGEEFFYRLEQLGPQQREVREIYYLCLALGFTGKFCKPGDDLYLEQLKLATLRLLGIVDPERISIFSVSEPPSTVLPSSISRRDFPWLWASCLVGPLLLFAVLFALYRFTLHSVGENFLRSVAN